MFKFFYKSFSNKIIMKQNLTADLGNIDSLKNNLRKAYKKLRNEKSEYLEQNPTEKLYLFGKLEENLNKLFIMNIKENSKIYVSCYYPIQNELDILNLLKILQNTYKDKFDLNICLPRTCHASSRILK
jgi:hypothetical protein